MLLVLADGPLRHALRDELRRAAQTPAPSGLDLVAETADPSNAVTCANEFQLDLALIDIEIGGLRTARRIRQQSPRSASSSLPVP